MVKPKGKIGVLQQEMDNKVYNHIIQLLEDKTDSMRAQGLTNGLFAMALARDLKLEEIIEYVRDKDRGFSRVKIDQIRKSVERTWKSVLDEEEEEMKDMGVNPDSLKETCKGKEEEEEEEEEDDDEALMEVKDLNIANKNIVNLWNQTSEKEESVTNSQNENNEDAITTTIISTNTKKRKKEGGKSSKRMKIDRSPPSITLSSLGGLNAIISELMEVVGMPILHPEIYLSTGIQPPRGVLLHGPPGCGKTTIANALAGDLKVPFINISAPSVVSGMSGESEKKLRDIFEEAKSLAPCLIFIDEIDAITPKRDGGAQREMERRIVAQLLTSMDELSLDKTGGKPVIVIGATNRPDSLDAALRRAGRFDREICINVPNEIARFNILDSMTRNLKVNGELGLKEIAKMTPGFVGADLKSLVTSAGVAAIKRIFGSLATVKTTITKLETHTLEGDDEMEIDNCNGINVSDHKNNSAIVINETNNDIIASDDHLSIIQIFLIKHPEPLTKAQLEPLSITREDFLTALPTIQPTAKREGFATVPDVTWNNVGALSNVRVELHMAIVQPIKRPDIYLKVGISAPAGVLMWGPPGCGKTLLAKAVANESKANFISVKGPELLNKYVGESERAVRLVFARARASVPCIIFFDELDALVPRRDTSLSESSSRVVNTLLTELDGLDDRKGIFVIGATNRPDMIDPAMLRPGRLDKTLYIELPNAMERLEILKTLVRTNGTPISEGVNLYSVAHDERCRNFSGADLSSLVREASVISLKRKFFTGIKNGDENIDENIDDSNLEEIVVNSEDFEKALDSVKPSVSDRDRAKYEKLNKRLGWDKTTTVQEKISGHDEN